MKRFIDSIRKAFSSKRMHLSFDLFDMRVVYFFFFSRKKQTENVLNKKGEEIKKEMT